MILQKSKCGSGFIFIFSHSSYRESLLVALPLHLTLKGFAPFIQKLN